MAAAAPVGGTRASELPTLPSLEASELISRATDRAFHDIRRLANVLSRVNLDSRREDLLDYIRLARARFVKTHATIGWLSGSHGELVVNAGKALCEARLQREQIDTCQDQFFFMHGALFGARQRLYDVPVAVHVLVGGQYPGLPKGIEYCGADIDPRPLFELPGDRKELVPRVDRAIKRALLRRGGVPIEFSSHDIANGVLTLAVKGEFQMVVTLHSEREEAQWSLLGVEVKVKAREGERIQEPATDERQQRYLYEVVQKAMEGDGAADADGDVRCRSLLAAYLVCHDFCCSLVLRLLHAQARMLAARIGGLWANQLEVVFNEDAEREFSTGLGGTGQDVGMGMRQVGVDPLQQYPRGKQQQGPGTGRKTLLPTAPEGCRYIRVHRRSDATGEIVASLGPVGGLHRNNAGAGYGDYDASTDASTSEGASGEGATRETLIVRPDELSCAQMLSAAARAFASQKMRALVADVRLSLRQIGIRDHRIAVDVVCDGHARISSSSVAGSALEVSVDIKSGRYLVKDLGCAHMSKAEAGCFSRLREALNLLPRTDTQTLGERVTGALATEGRNANSARGADRTGEQQDLRQQQVRRCVGECFTLLRRGDVELLLRRSHGLVPHQRWQALLGRADVWTRDLSLNQIGTVESSGRTATYCLIHQFREEGGCRISYEWRNRSRSSQRGSEIELTRAERAATTSAAHADSGGLGLTLANPSPAPDLGGPGSYQGLGGALAASLVEGSDAGEDFGYQMSGGGVGASIAGPSSSETSEVLSFFLEVAIADSLELEHTLIAATLRTTGRARSSFRPVVSETYSLNVSTGAERLAKPEMLKPQQGSILGKRPASNLGGKVPGGAASQGEPTNSVEELTEDTFTYTLGTKVSKVAKLESLAVQDNLQVQPSGRDGIRSEVQKAVQMAAKLVPFARLQHAIRRVGAGLSIDIHELNRPSATFIGPACCSLRMASGDGWSSRQVLAESGKIAFFPGHVGADCWEWDVTLNSDTMLMDYEGQRRPNVLVKDEATERALMDVIHEALPLAGRVRIAPSGLSSADTGKAGGTARGPRHLKMCFPTAFPVHTMCLSFAWAGEGLSALQTLVAQATSQMQSQQANATEGYRAVSHSPIHVALRDDSSHHVVLLTHSAFSEKHTAAGKRPGLVLMPLGDGVPTCPAAIEELEAAVTKHRDLRALSHALTRTLPILAAVSRVVPDVGSGAGDRRSLGRGSLGESVFQLKAISPASYILSSRSATRKRPPLGLVVEASGLARVSGLSSESKRDDVVADTTSLRDLLLEWIATGLG